MEKWMVQAKKADFQHIAGTFGITPVTARLIRNRDVIEEKDIQEYLYGTFDSLADPLLMKDMEKAAAILFAKIEDGEAIRVIGDYDCDGISSTYILTSGLRDLGARVDYDIPDRIKDGYGINRQLIEKALSDGVNTILTCDNGIAATEEIAFAKEMGLTVIITDHHEIPPQGIPAADAVVNPKREDCPYPFKGLCGAAIAFRLTEALFAMKGQGEAARERYVEFAALATVTDVMELQGENRILVKEGLKAMSHTKNVGLTALMEACGIIPENLSAYHFGFVLGPCLNASGRLSTAKQALELLMTKDKTRALVLAEELKALNDTRKDMTEEGKEAAFALIEKEHMENDSVLVIFLPDCHESIAGIIAGRIREAFCKPTLVLTKAEEGAKGSGRSIPAYSMFEKLVECSDLLTKFGGHPMAAGLSLPEENIPLLRKRLNENAGLCADDFVNKVWIDVAMPFSYINEQQIEELGLLAPFGNGNSKPVFAAKNLHIRRLSVLGKNRNAVKLQLADQTGVQMEAMWFGDSEEFLSALRVKYGESELDALLHGANHNIHIMATYYPTIKEFRGEKSIQLIIQNYIA